MRGGEVVVLRAKGEVREGVFKRRSFWTTRRASADDFCTPALAQLKRWQTTRSSLKKVRWAGQENDHVIPVRSLLAVNSPQEAGVASPSPPSSSPSPP